MLRKFVFVLTIVTLVIADVPVEDASTTPISMNTKELEDCCRWANVDAKCMHLCTTNVNTIIAAEDVVLCLPYLQNLIYCASGGKDFSSCCKGRGVQVSCLDLCNGEKNQSISNMHMYTKCVAVNLPTAYMCFTSGFQPPSLETKKEGTPEALISTKATCQDLQCFADCQYGYETGPAGCKTCECINPCQGLTCPSSKMCQPSWISSSQKFVGLCTDIPPRRSCASPLCLQPCQYGTVKTPDGCDTCDCRDPCQAVTCAVNEVCIPFLNIETTLYEGRCEVAPPRASCILANCSNECNFGFSTDQNNCPTCLCADPCKNITCPQDTGCVPIKLNETTYVATCTGNPFPKCLPISCKMACQYGFKKDSNGCEICDCFYPCENVSCANLEVCLTEKDNNNVYKAVCKAPNPLCNPVLCDMLCEIGFVKDENGCDTCKCVNPCETIRCSNGFECKPIKVDNNYIGTCISLPCDQIKCQMDCSFGREKDQNGCDTCICMNPCKDTVCLPGSVCTPVKSNINDEFVGKCEVFKNGEGIKCPEVMCLMACEFGFEKDVNGCDICKCFDYCQEVVCNPGFSCQTIRYNNTDDYTGKCIENKCSQISCRMECMYGFEKNSDGCEICHCYDPCKETVCLPGTTCYIVKSNITHEYQGKCTVPFSSLCPNKTCMNECQFGYLKDENGCENCLCGNPCENIQCFGDYKCLPVKSLLTNEYVPTCQRIQDTTISLLSVASSGNRDLVFDTTTQIPIIFSKQFNVGTSQYNNPGSQFTTNNLFNTNPNPNTNFITTNNIYNTNSFNTIKFPTPFPTTKLNLFSTPEVKCANTPCPIACPFGFEKVENEYCTTCECHEPCKNIQCEADTVCQIIKIDTSFKALCTSQGPLICPPMICQINCEFGMKKDFKGCNICECFNPCETHPCNDGETCRVRKEFESASITECIPETNVTRPNCQDLSCPAICLHGKQLDEQGCDTCNCIEPCKNIKCNYGSECNILKIGANNFLGICMPIMTTPILNNLSTSKINPAAAICLAEVNLGACGGALTGWYYNSMSMSCRPLKSGCQGAGLNAFRTREDCENICTPIFPMIQCTQHTCMRGCQYGRIKDIDGCETCECAQPCQNFECEAGKICVINKKTQCVDDMCILVDKGECKTKIVCPKMSCTFVCAYGFNKDSNGCDTCSCYNPCLTCNSGKCKVNGSCLFGNCDFTCLPACVMDNTDPMKCTNSLCRYGFDLNSFGCNECQCFDPCKDVQCSPGTYCKGNDQGSYVSNPDGTLKRIFTRGICQGCMRPACFNNCQYGYENDANGCPTCVCKVNDMEICLTIPDPMDKDGIRNTSFCIDKKEPCKCLQNALAKKYMDANNVFDTANQFVVYPELNCNSDNTFKASQCVNSKCFCVNKIDGHIFSPISLYSIKCYENTQFATFRLDTDYYKLNSEEAWVFKQEISKQIASYLNVDENFVAITNYSAGSIVVNCAIGQETMNQYLFIDKKLHDLAAQPMLPFEYKGEKFGGRLEEFYSRNQTSTSPNAVSSVSQTNWNKFILLVTLIPILISLLIVTCVVAIICCKRKQIYEHEEKPSAKEVYAQLDRENMLYPPIHVINIPSMPASIGTEA